MLPHPHTRITNTYNEHNFAKSNCNSNLFTSILYSTTNLNSLEPASTTQSKKQFPSGTAICTMKVYVNPKFWIPRPNTHTPPRTPTLVFVQLC